MRTVQVDLVAKTVRELCISANHELRADHIAALRRGLANERSEIGCNVLRRLLESAEVSAKEQMAFCQDTGYAVVFLHVGQDVHFTGGDLNAAIDRGVAEGYRDGYLRSSLVRSPSIGAIQGTTLRRWSTTTLSRGKASPHCAHQRRRVRQHERDPDAHPRTGGAGDERLRGRNH